MRRRDNGESGCEVFADSHPWYGVMDMTGSDPVIRHLRSKRKSPSLRERPEALPSLRAHPFPMQY
jgi:hypothetical protein